MNSDKQTKIEEIVRMLCRVDVRTLRLVYFTCWRWSDGKEAGA